MGRSEALTVAALGRSPYDDVVIQPRDPGQQRFDDRGHPVNARSRRSIKDFIRASNEVLKAAGIIEEDSEVRARDDAYHRSLARETETGIRLVEVGRLLLVTGVWGVCGLRRRILFHRSHRARNFSEVINVESYHSIRRLFAGTPSMLAYQALEWVSLIFRALITGSYEESLAEDRNRVKEVSRFRRYLWKVVDLAITYASIPLNMLAIIQQLGYSRHRYFPSPWAFIPFSAASPLHFELPPPTLQPGPLYLWGFGLLRSVMPAGLVLLYYRLTPSVSYSIFSTIYMTLPKPVNRSSSARSSFMGGDQPRSTPTAMNALPAPETVALGLNSDELLPVAELVDDLPPTPAPDSDAVTVLEGGPSQHTATLRALEGQAPANATAIDQDLSDDENEVAQTTLISFDVEPTGIPESNAGPWSAELRNTNEAPARPKDDVVYHITALTLLPPLLAAEGLSTVATNIILLPLEGLMVSAVIGSYHSLLREQGTLFGLKWVDVASISMRNIVNLLAVQALELSVTGIVWAGLTIVLKKYGDRQIERASSEKGEDEI